jgi:hypothetical protein
MEITQDGQTNKDEKFMHGENETTDCQAGDNVLIEIAGNTMIEKDMQANKLSE